MSEIGLHEILLVGSLVVVTVALWPIAEAFTEYGRVALLFPGLVVLWVTLPSRKPFVRAAPLVGKRKRAE